MKKRWQDFEDQVRDIAARIYGKPCKPAHVGGSDVDGVITLDKSNTVLIETTVNCTIEKVRNDLNKLVNARNALFMSGVFARCIIVIDREPTTSMLQEGDGVNIDVISSNQLAASFIEYERYRSARTAYPFGSAVDPKTGDLDTIQYVPVSYVDRATSREYTPKDLADRLLNGENIILLGEYGSGKSRCISELFGILSTHWGVTFQFPIAINLRECWGLEAADELIRRHFSKLGLEDMKGPAVRAYNQKTLLFLFDGFDEIGTQSWSSDDARLRQLRAQALIAVKSAVQNAGTGSLVAGRDHYFSSDKEMFSALGMSSERTLVVHAKEEFSLDETVGYFKSAGISTRLPEWLPRRPLICQTIAQLKDEERNKVLNIVSGEASFWNYFIQVICERDARINAAFDSSTIYEVFLELAGLTRNKPANVGPIDQRELREAFEAVVGKLPVEEAAVMLQRLPSLGRVGPDSGDRQFIDTYILDGLRAHHVARLLDADEEKRKDAFRQTWANPLDRLGQLVLASRMEGKSGAFLGLSVRSTQNNNATLAADIASSLMFTGTSVFDYGGLTIKNASISHLDFSQIDAEGLNISGSVIEGVTLPTAPPKRTLISDNLIGRVYGASSVDGLGNWIKSNEIDEFDSVTTVERIRNVGLSPAHEILVTIIRKTFFQPGSGRKEEALLRGFAAGTFNKLAPKVLNLLTTEGVLTHFRGEEGRVYAPNRAHAGRMKQMLAELRSSTDEIWAAAGRL